MRAPLFGYLAALIVLPGLYRIFRSRDTKEIELATT